MRSPGPGPSRRLELRPAAEVAAAGALVLIAALVFAGPPLLVPGVGLALLGLLSTAWIALCARNLTVARQVAERRVVEGEAVEVLVELRHRRWLPGATLHDELTRTAIRLDGRDRRDRDDRAEVEVRRRRKRTEVRIRTRAERRGRRRVPPPAVELSDPLGLARAITTGGGAGSELLVLPRTEPVSWGASGQGLPTGDQPIRTARDPLGAGDVDGLRGYRPGTPATRIHWPALARGAGLLERRLAAAVQVHPLIVLDARTDGCADAERLLDDAIRAAASLTLELARRGGAALLLPGARSPIAVTAELSAWPAAHARLAVVESQPRAAAGPPVGRLRARSQAVIYVCADPVEREQALSGLDADVLVLPAGLDPGLPDRPIFRVNRCAGYRLPARVRRLAA